MLRSLQYNMLFLDPPDHTRLRGLVHKAFTPRLIERMRSRMEVLADALLDDAANSSEFDLVSDYALPIPATVIADLLGVPATDRDRFHHWSSVMVSITSAPDLLKALPSALMFMRYLRRLSDLRLAVAPSSLPWRRSLFLRGIDHLPLTVVHTAARAAA